MLTIVGVLFLCCMLVLWPISNGFLDMCLGGKAYVFCNYRGLVDTPCGVVCVCSCAASRMTVSQSYLVL